MLKFLLSGALALAAMPALAETLTAGALVGEWPGEETTGDFVMQGKATFAADGSFARTSATEGFAATFLGTWEVTGGNIVFTLTDYEPKVLDGVAVAPPPPTEIWVVEEFTGDALRATVTFTTLTYSRVE